MYFTHPISKQYSPCSRLWRRVHRPEEYAEDVVRYVAGEMRLPPALLMPMAPVARRMVSSWADAAVETTAYSVFPCGRRSLSTVFNITNYSHNAVYGLVERIMKGLGIGRGASRDSETEFAWVLLGGVLNDYAVRAGLRPESTRKLLDFRLRNSDYFTCTTWFPDTVEIVNLVSGKVDTLSLPPDDIDNVVNYALRLQTTFHGKKSRIVESCEPAAEEFCRYMTMCENARRYGNPNGLC